MDTSDDASFSDADGKPSDVSKEASAMAVDAPVSAAVANPSAARETQAALSVTFRAVLVTAVVVTGLSALAFDLRIGAAVLVGGILATLNLMLFARLVRAFIDAEGVSAPWAVLGGLKLVGLFVCVYILVARGGVSPLGLAIGYASLPIGIAFSTLQKPKAR